jgi:ferrochelatase
MPEKTAVLLTNLGTPDTLEVASVKRFLKEFLSDPLVVRLPRLLWLPLLHGVILPLRSHKTLQAYGRVWGEDGSPLLAYCKKQRAALQEKLFEQTHVELAMRYGNPSFISVLRLLRDAGVDKLVVLPLYPQYSVTTTATSYKHLINTLKQLDYAPTIEFIGYYPEHPAYIDALAESIREHWRQGQRHLLMSFHGLPQANVDRGDPYQRQCQQSAQLLAAKLGLGDDDWSIGYQSRFGKQAWIQPYTSDVLRCRLPGILRGLPGNPGRDRRRVSARVSRSRRRTVQLRPCAQRPRFAHRDDAPPGGVLSGAPRIQLIIRFNLNHC